MNASMLIQIMVIVLIVGWSGLFAVRRLMPVTSRRAQARIVDALDHSPVPAWLRRLSRRWQPQSTSGGSCSDGCSTCGGCASASAIAKPDVATQPLAFRQRTRA